MAFLPPDPTGVAGTLGLNGDQGLPPLAQNKPNAIKSLSRKYAGDNLTSTQQLYGKDVVNSFVKWELERAQRGIPPTSNDQTMKLLAAAKTKQAQTAAPERDPLDFLGNAAEDVGDIVTSIPHMPQQVTHDILHAGDAFSAIQSGDIGQIAKAPLIRMIPGVYTASNLLQGNISELASHPVMTGLDVLPYAAKGLKIPVGEDGATVASKLAESPVGEAVDRAKGVIGRSMPGQLAQEAWGHSVRGVTKILAQESNLAPQAMLPELHTIYNEHVDTLAQNATAASRKLNEAIPDPARMATVTQAIADPASIGATDMHSALDAVNATDAERAAVLQEREASKAFEQHGIDQDAINQRVVMGQPEVFTPKQAAKLDSTRGLVTRADTITTLRESILHPDTADFGALEEKVNTALQDPTLNMRAKRSVANGYVHALDAAGYDTGTMLSDIGKANKSTITSALYDDSGALRATPGEEGALRTRRRTGNPALDSPTRWLEEHKGFTQKSLAKLNEKLGTKETRTLPARWQPTFQRIKMDKASAYVAQTIAADDPALPALMDNIHQHIYSDLGPDAVRAINNDALETVADLRKQGINPEFVHAVSRDQVRAMSNPTITTIIPKASQYGVRLNDWTPSADSLSVSISHQGLELVRQRGAQYAVGKIRDSYATSVRDATAELRPVAERAAARSGLSVGEELERLVNKKYNLWSETENGFVAGRAQRVKLTQIGADTMKAGDTLLIEKPIARSIAMLASPPTYSRIFDPVLKVFRTAVLPYSPRFHLNNIVGGMVGALLEDPRVVSKLPEAAKFSKAVSDIGNALNESRGMDIDAATLHILERMPREMRAELGGLKYSVAPEGTFKMKAGATLGDFAEKSGMNRIAKAGGNVADWSYGFNETVDTAYRMAGYLSGEEHALKAGLSPEEAAARGMALADKFQPRWLEMTPMERSVFRVLVPFYGYMSHVFRFASRFPIDHPWRTAVMANMARAELEDFGTGLPQSLAAAFFLGKPDAQGNVTAITPGAANPFRDLGDNLTLAGFLGQTNPVFKTALTQLGYDPVSRGPNLYPEVEYDPDTGRFKQTNKSTPGLVGQAIGAVVPQANILAALTGTSGDFRNLLESNPDAASRMLASSTGIPILWKKYNVNEEAFSAELNREQDSKTTLAAAMRTGDYSKAMRYPQLRATVRALQKLQAAGKLQPYEAGVTPSLAANDARQAGSQATTQAEVK